ncbi:hypothetical protein [Allokutzneria albata]|nr:hypothetical protein [Allokutzneria albata]
MITASGRSAGVVPCPAPSISRFPLSLRPEERGEMIEQVHAVVRSEVDKVPAPGRTRHLLTPILIPVASPGASLPR